MKQILGSIIISTFCFLPIAVSAQQVTPSIKLNQVGFYTEGPKVAIVTGSTNAGTFYITATNGRDTFFRGALSAEQASLHSSTVTKKADFSAFNKRGSYVVLVPGVGHSYVFQIADS